MAVLVYALGEDPSLGWASAQIFGSLVTAVVLLGAFVLRQGGGSDRLLPLRVILDRNRGRRCGGALGCHISLPDDASVLKHGPAS